MARYRRRRIPKKIYRAYRRQSRWRAKYPSKDYATVAVKRGGLWYGDATTTDIFGKDVSSATPEQLARRKAVGYTGRGGYLSSAWKMARPFVKKHGMNLLRDAAGSFLGSGLYTGRGEYNRNQLVDPSGPAEVAGAGDETGSVTLTRTELVGEIYGPSTPFQNNQFALNPGLESTFPWLSQIAANYEEYSFHQLIFSFRSTVTDIGSSTTGQIGSVIMCTNYNASASAFKDKPEMMAYMGACSSKASENLIHGVECDPAKLTFSEGYVRTGPPTGNMDLKVYDHGLFQLAVANSPSANANLSVGELWVSYAVELRKPKFGTARGNTIQQDIYVSGSTPILATGSGATNRLLSDNVLQAQCNNINTLLTQGVRTFTVTFPAYYSGTVQIEFIMAVTTWANAQPTRTITTAGNVTLISDMFGAGAATSTNYIAEPPVTGGGQFVMVVDASITPSTGGVSNSVTITIGSPSSAVTLVRSALYIREINPTFSSRAQNVGPANAQSDAPILINSSGVITQPI